MIRAVLVAALMTPTAFASDPDLPKLQGQWVLAQLRENDDHAPDEIIKTGKLEIRGDEYHAEIKGRPVKLAFKLDSSKSPKQIDVTIPDGPSKGKQFAGIYKIEGDTVTICRPRDPGGARPTAFDPAKNANQVQTVWKRVK